MLLLYLNPSSNANKPYDPLRLIVIIYKRNNKCTYLIGLRSTSLRNWHGISSPGVSVNYHSYNRQLDKGGMKLAMHPSQVKEKTFR